MSKKVRIALAVFIMVSFVSIALSGCGSAANQEKQPVSTQIESTNTSTQTANTPEKKVDGNLEVCAFVNGSTYEGFCNYAVDEFKKTYPDVKVTTLFSPDVRDVLRPRFVAGNPPDVIIVMGPTIDDFAKYAQGGEYTDLTEWLNTAQAIGYDGLIKDNMLFQSAKFDGKAVSVPYFYCSMNGFYYNKKMAEENGWEPPKNWDDFVKLAPKIKEKGIYPFIYQGKYPFIYPYSSFIENTVVANGGRQLLVDQSNLVKGSYSNPVFVEAMKNWEFCSKNDYFPKSCIGISHTEAQLEWLHGKAFMVPCGSWLEGEMAKDVPEGFEMGFIPTFSQAADKKPAMNIYITNVVVPQKAKNKDNAFEFLRVLYSKNVVLKSPESGVGPAVIKDDFAGVEITPSVQALASALKAGTIDGYLPEAGSFEPYNQLNDFIGNCITAIAQGDKTADKAVEEIEAKAQEIANDNSIPKIKVN